jgi:hypothetical protein
MCLARAVCVRSYEVTRSNSIPGFRDASSREAEAVSLTERLFSWLADWLSVGCSDAAAADATAENGCVGAGGTGFASGCGAGFAGKLVGLWNRLPVAARRRTAKPAAKLLARALQGHLLVAAKGALPDAGCPRTWVVGDTVQLMVCLDMGHVAVWRGGTGRNEVT